MDKQKSTYNETARIEAFSDSVFAVAITLLIFQIGVPPHEPPGGLRAALVDLWPLYLAFLASFMTIGVMWLNHHRLFSQVTRKDDGLIVLNLLLLLVTTWLPFPSALLAEHLRGPHDDQRTAGVVSRLNSFLTFLRAFSRFERERARSSRSTIRCTHCLIAERVL